MIQRFWFFMILMALSPSWAQELKRRKIDPSFKVPESRKVRVAFFDADSTLRISRSGSPSANSATDVVLLPGVAAEIARLVAEGYLVVIVSNQGGIPKFISLENADAALMRTRELTLKENSQARFHYHDFAEFDDGNRKPGIDMALRIESELKKEFGADVEVDKEGSFMVGDSAYKAPSGNRAGDLRPDGRRGFDFSNSDRHFAINYGIPFFEPQFYFGWIKDGIERFMDIEDVLDYWKKKAASCEITLRD
jgi:DNA 3'-phosphatase